MNVSRRERAMLLAAGAVTLLIGVPGLLLPSGKGPSKAPTTSELAQQSRQRRDLVRQLVGKRAEVEKLTSERERLLSHRDVRGMVQEMVRASQRSARVAGLRIADLKPLPPEKSAGLQRVPLQLSVTAPFSPTVRFLYELQQGGQGFHVEEARLSSTGAQQVQMDLELRLVGYVRSEEDANASGS